MNRESLFDHLKNNSRVLNNKHVHDAFLFVDRAHFLDEDYQSEAYEDYALPIGFNQTISQPTTVAFMLELLDVAPGDTVFDVGSGSGYTTALIATALEGKGKVIGFEIIPELVEKGRVNIEKYDFKNAIIEQGNRTFETVNEDHFNKILVSAAAADIPQHLLDKLTVGGTMVIPIGNSIVKIEKVSKDSANVKSYEGFSFVPLEYTE